MEKWILTLYICFLSSCVYKTLGSGYCSFEFLKVELARGRNLEGIFTYYLWYSSGVRSLWVEASGTFRRSGWWALTPLNVSEQDMSKVIFTLGFGHLQENSPFLTG